MRGPARPGAGWRARALLALGLGAALACAGAGARTAGEVSEPLALDGWRRAEQRGLVIYTNAPDATARAAFRQMQRFVDFVSRFVHRRDFRPERPIEVFVFRSRSEYQRFAPSRVGGHALEADGRGQVALSIEQVFEGTEILYHELVHGVLLEDPERRFPSWFQEGLAVFFSTSVVRGDVLTVGGLSPWAVAQLRRPERPLPLAGLLGSPASAQPDIGLFYAEAWAFVHYGLRSAAMDGPQRRDEFGGFVSRVSRGEAWEPALHAAFTATPEEIAEEHERHRRKLAEARVLTLANIPLELGEPELGFEPLDRLAIARQLAQLGSQGYEAGFDSVAWLYDELLEARPNDPEAICGRVRLAARQGELERGRTLWERLDEDERGRVDARLAEADLALARARRLRRKERATLGAPDLARAIDGYGFVLARAPQSYSARVGLGKALVLAEDTDPAAGISALEGAVEMTPEEPEVRLDLAELLIRSGATAAAERHIDYVANAYPDSPHAARAARLRRRLG